MQRLMLGGAAAIAVAAVNVGASLRATGATRPTLTATPRNVVPGHPVRFAGHHWPRPSVCAGAEVTLSVKAGPGQLGILVGERKVRRDGSFDLR